MLIDIDNAVLSHVASIFNKIDPVTFPNADRFALILVDDQKTHLRLIEELVSERNLEPPTSTPNTSERRFPFILIFRGNPVSRLNSASSSKAAIREIICENPGDGSAVVCDGKQVDIDYVIYQYTTNMVDLSRTLQWWFVNIGETNTRMTFNFSEPEITVPFDGNIAFEEPSSVRPTVDEVESRNSIFVQNFPFTLATIILWNIRVQNEIILDPQLTVTIWPIDHPFPS